MNEKGQEFQWTRRRKPSPPRSQPRPDPGKREPGRDRGKPGAQRKPAPATSEADRDVSKPDAAGVANVTETNVVKAKSFNDQVSKAKQEAEPALSLEGTIGFLLPEGRACRPCA